MEHKEHLWWMLGDRYVGVDIEDSLITEVEIRQTPNGNIEVLDIRETPLTTTERKESKDD